MTLQLGRERRPKGVPAGAGHNAKGPIMADETYNSGDAEMIDRLGVRIIDVMDDEGAGADERVLALLNVLEFTIAAVECPGCRKQMVKALRQAIPAMLRNIPTLAAELHAEAPTESTHVH